MAIMTSFMWKNYFRHTTKEKEITTVLKENILFQDLTGRQLKFVSKIVHLRKYHSSEIIFRQGEAGVGMYIVVSGAVSIKLEDSSAAPGSEKNEIVIVSMSPGDFFGELTLVEESGKRSAAAVADEETTLIGFFKPDLLKIIERNPTTGIKISLRLGEVLGRRLKETNERVSKLEEKLERYRLKK